MLANATMCANNNDVVRHNVIPFCALVGVVTKNLLLVFEAFKLQNIATWVLYKHGGLVAGFVLKPYMRLYNKLNLMINEMIL